MGFRAYSVKLLAEELKVPVFEQETSTKKKSPGLRDLTPIIDDIKLATPKLDALLIKRKNPRDALIHGNFHQLKTHSFSGKKKEQAKRLHGAVWQLHLGTQNLERMSEVEDLDNIKKN